MINIEIDNNNNNQRLDKFLLKFLNKSNKSFIYKMLRKKNIKLNGKKASGSEILEINDTVTLYLSDETINKFKQYKADYSNYKELNKNSIIYEDENIIIINKPIGTIVHSSTDNEKENTLINSLIKYLIETGSYEPENCKGFKPAICNRLDVNTTGILVAGKNLGSLQELNQIFRERKVDKFYETIVNGVVEKNGIIKGFHKKDTTNNIVEIFKEDKNNELKKMYTEYFIIKNSQEFTHLEIKLITGKTHQIRVSLQDIKHSIIGDKKYGNELINKRFSKNYKLNNQLLHAYKLKFNKIEGKLSYLSNKEFLAKKPEVFCNIERDLFKL